MYIKLQNLMVSCPILSHIFQANGFLTTAVLDYILYLITYLAI